MLIQYLYNYVPEHMHIIQFLIPSFFLSWFISVLKKVSHSQTNMLFKCTAKWDTLSSCNLDSLQSSSSEQDWKLSTVSCPDNEIHRDLFQGVNIEVFKHFRQMELARRYDLQQQPMDTTVVFYLQVTEQIAIWSKNRLYQPQWHVKLSPVNWPILNNSINK